MNPSPPTPPRPELLAPGGSPEAIVAALENGANAIYTGAGELNARARARNLSVDQLDAMAAFVHRRGAKLYLALNVPLQPATGNRFAELLARAALAGADGVILRDERLIAAARAIVPDLPLHVSTQAGVADAAAAVRMRDLGARRVILARELSKDAIAAIIRAVPELEYEVFVFGAMCFSVSGSCLLGEAVNRRSGNYGDCCQACRLEYFDADQQSVGRLFSMRDLDLFGRVPELLELGLAGLKIEGRLKSPAWVGCVTHWLRRALDHPGKAGLTPAERRQFHREVSVLHSRPRGEGFFGGATDRARLTDPGGAGHQGLNVPVFSVTDREKSRFVAFTTPVELAIRDGLRCEVAAGTGGRREVFLAIRTLMDGHFHRRNVVAAGKPVRIPVPRDWEVKRLAIHSAKSVERKYLPQRSVPDLTVEPPVTFTAVELTPTTLTLTARQGGFELTMTVNAATEPATGAGFSPAMAATYFGGAVRCQLAPGLYFNPTLLRAAKRQFLGRFAAARDKHRRELTGRLRANLARVSDHLPADTELLARGVAAVSRVTGFTPQVVRTSGGTTFAIEPGKHGTTVKPA